MDNNEDLTSTEKFTGTMDVQEKLKFPDPSVSINLFTAGAAPGRVKV